MITEKQNRAAVPQTKS